MKERPNYYPIGVLRKPHGNLGGISFHIDDDKIEREFSRLKHIFLTIDGLFVPFFIKENNEDNYSLLFLEEIHGPEQVSKISGKKIYVTADQMPEALHNVVVKFGNLEGYQISANGKILGIIEEIMEYPSQIMANVVIDDKKVLIPIIDEFIDKIDVKTEILYLNLPQGILEIN